MAAGALRLTLQLRLAANPSREPGDQPPYWLSVGYDDPKDERRLSPAEGPALFDLAKLLECQLDPRKYGELLSDQLFCSQAPRDRFLDAERLAEQRECALRLLLDIHPAAAALHSLRWELLRHPRKKNGQQALLATSQRLIFSRLSHTDDVARLNPIHVQDLRALVLVSAPEPSALQGRGLATIDFDDEVEAVAPLLQNADIASVSVPGSSTEPLTIARFEAALEVSPHIVYLVSHGVRTEHRDIPALVFQREERAEDGRHLDYLQDDKFVDLLRTMKGGPPRLVVLSACHGAGDGNHHSSSTVHASLATELARAGVPAVISMHGQVSMDTVHLMMPTLFAELMAHGQVDRALAAARKKVCARHDAWMPVLHMHLREGQLWTPGDEASHIHCVLLCGGPGRRLWPVTQTTPKVLLPLGEDSILERLLEQIESSDLISGITLSTDPGDDPRHKLIADRIHARYPLGGSKGRPIIAPDAERGRGPLAALRDVARTHESDLLIVGADNIFDSDFEFDSLLKAALEAKLGGRGRVGAIVTIRHDPDTHHREQLGQVVTDEHGKVEALHEKTTEEHSDSVSTACYFLRREHLAQLRTFRKISHSATLGEFINYLIGVPDLPDIVAHEFEGEWFDMGDIDTYLKASSAYFRDLPPPAHQRSSGGGPEFVPPLVLRTKAKAPSLQGAEKIGPNVYLGHGVQITKGSILENCVVLDGAHIMNAEVRNALIGPNTTVEGVFEYSVCGPNTKVAGPRRTRETNPQPVPKLVAPDSTS